MLRSIKEMLDYSILANDSTVDIPREYETRLHDHYGYPYYWQP